MYFARSGKTFASPHQGFDRRPRRRFCYVGSDSFAEGRISRRTIGELAGGSGKFAVIIPDDGSVNRRLRRKGALSVLTETYPSMVEIDTVSSHQNGNQTYRLCKTLLRKHRDLKVLYVTEGVPP